MPTPKYRKSVCNGKETPWSTVCFREVPMGWSTYIARDFLHFTFCSVSSIRSSVKRMTVGM